MKINTIPALIGTEKPVFWYPYRNMKTHETYPYSTRQEARDRYEGTAVHLQVMQSELYGELHAE